VLVKSQDGAICHYDNVETKVGELSLENKMVDVHEEEAKYQIIVKGCLIEFLSQSQNMQMTYLNQKALVDVDLNGELTWWF